MFVVCIKWLGTMFTKGKVYKVEDGLVQNNDGNYSTELKVRLSHNFRYAYKNEVKGL